MMVGIKLEMLEKCLADETLYTDLARKDELTRMVKEQGSLKSGIDTLEWEWLEASEALEKAE